MTEKKIVLIIADGHEYIRHIGADAEKYGAEMNQLYEIISNVYLPLLNMFDSLERENVPFKVALVLSPAFCTLLSDAEVQQQYIAHLEKRIELGKRELERMGDDAAVSSIIKFIIEKAEEDKFAFSHIYGQNLLAQFSEYAKRGYVELLATCGTNIFLPHYADMQEVLNAQVETGLYAHRTFFGSTPRGFWLPGMGYMPGIERVLSAYGAYYTVLDARAFLFSDDDVKKGIFAPVLCPHDIIAFARDNRIDEEIFGASGYATSSVYCDTRRDIGFELPFDEPSIDGLSSFFGGGGRYATGYHYWNRGGGVYQPDKAMRQCEMDAVSFINKKYELLEKVAALFSSETNASLVCTFTARELAQRWLEFAVWIEQVFRAAQDASISFALPEELLSLRLQHIHPYYSAAIGMGYGETLLADKNNYLLRNARKASARMIDLAERFPDDTGLKARLLNVGARELLLAESSGWANMIWTDTFPEYAAERFDESLAAFTKVFESLGANSMSTGWLTEYEVKRPIFPWLNYRIFSRKR